VKKLLAITLITTSISIPRVLNMGTVNIVPESNRKEPDGHTHLEIPTIFNDNLVNSQFVSGSVKENR
jgi:hypothetical protein